MQSPIYSRVPTLLVLSVGLGVVMFWGAISPTFSQWTSDRNNTAVCTAAGNQILPKMVSDQAGGMIVAWNDDRPGFAGIYAQRLNVLGVAQWTTDGVVICGGSWACSNHTLAGDGAGGAIIAWVDNRNGNRDIYAQRIDASGVVQWTANGVAICTAPGSQFDPDIVSDGAGGAIITWEDWRSGYAIYAQRLNPSGVVLWPADGVPITTKYSPANPTLVSDGEGGAIIVWDDDRFLKIDIYAQHINASGIMLWPATGAVVCSYDWDQRNPLIVSDGAGGVIVTWEDERRGFPDVYAQRLNASGTIQWAPSGVVICSATGIQSQPAIISDSHGGAIIAWADNRSNNWDIYAQSINDSGKVQWTTDGVAISTAPGNQASPAMVSDGNGGAIIAWQDEQNGWYNIRVQHLDPWGTVHWVKNGLHISTSIPKKKENPAICSDGVGGAIVTWQDERSGNFDIYAQRVGRRGELAPKPKILSAKDVPNDQGGKVLVVWQASDLDTMASRAVQYYSIWRAIYQPMAPAHLEWVGNHPKHHLLTYAYAVPTYYDSMATTNGKHWFMVSAHTADQNIFWDSDPAVSYSVDNLPPGAPKNLTGKAIVNKISLQWNPNQETDLAFYQVYRSLTPNFDVHKMPPYATTADTSYVDANVELNKNYYYAICAMDVHGNQSEKSNEAAIILVAVNERPELPTQFMLEQNYPNPFNPETEIRFALPEASHVVVKIFNTLGEEIRTLVSAQYEAGYHGVVWDGKNNKGNLVPSGVYFYQLRAGTFSQIRKMSLVR